MQNHAPHIKPNQQSKEHALLEALCQQHALVVTPSMIDKLVQYGELLQELNKKINLISRKEDAPIIIKHIFHSLLITKYHTFQAGEKVLDLGTGGGLPGIPLAIMLPNTSFLLVDATGKKIAACKEMIRLLQLQNVTAKHIRVEELHGITFQTVVSRQVALLAKLCAYAAPLLDANGKLICLKGGNLETELRESLETRDAHHGFPARVEEHPIENIDPIFSEKKIVVAYR